MIPGSNAHCGVSQKGSRVTRLLRFPLPVLYLQLHPGTDLLLGFPEGELRAEDVDHDGGVGGLQHHPSTHARPRPGRL